MFIDGMIHDYAYANTSMMEGFALNPMDVVDIDDISDITVIKDGVSFLGAAGSGGVININTEQKGKASTVIKFSTYGGVSTAPQTGIAQCRSQFNSYFSDIAQRKGYDGNQINTMYPWLNGNASTPDYYRYNNNTDWQQ
jgi:hypothetical protein